MKEEPRDKFYTKEQFNQIRKDILEFFDDPDINSMYRIQKSSYNWSSKNSWHFNLDFYSNWRAYGDHDPAERIRIVKKLIDMAQKIIEEDDRSFKMLRFNNSGDYNFGFIFQPTVVHIKEMLIKGGK